MHVVSRKHFLNNFEVNASELLDNLKDKFLKTCFLGTVRIVLYLIYISSTFSRNSEAFVLEILEKECLCSWKEALSDENSYIYKL